MPVARGRGPGSDLPQLSEEANGKGAVWLSACPGPGPDGPQALRAPWDLQEDVMAAVCHPPLVGPAPNSPLTSPPGMEPCPHFTGTEEEFPQAASGEQRGGGTSRVVWALTPQCHALPGQSPQAASKCEGWSTLEKADSYTPTQIFHALKNCTPNPISQMRKQFPPGQEGGP